MSGKTLSPLPATTSDQTVLRWEIQRLTTLDELYRLRHRWQSLAANALEANVFYEPWLMLPALEQFHRKLSLEVYAVSARCAGRSRLAALIPFEYRQPSLRQPYPLRRLLRYYYCGLCTPLLDRQLGVAAFRRFLALIASQGGCYEFRCIRTDGPARAALQPVLAGGSRLKQAQRAMLRPSGTADDYLHATFSSKQRKDLRRLERRLAGHGELRYDALLPGAPQRAATIWTEEFLQLEAGGWKGRQSTALAAQQSRREFFRTICHDAHARGQLELYALRLQGRALAMLCLFAAQDGYFAFRTAYDEDWARHSPGMLLCVWHSCEMHRRPRVRWLDSCADPASRLDNRIWQQRLALGDFRLNYPSPVAGKLSALLDACGVRFKTLLRADTIFSRRQ